MESRRVSVIIVLIAWFLLMPFLWLITWAKGDMHSFLTYSITLYLIALPFGMVRFVEKQSCVERFGIQSFRFLVLMSLIFTSLAITYLSGIVDSTAFLSIVLAPISEEIFFRGYVMGRFRNERTLSSRKRSLAVILLTSVIFALSHSFKYDAAGVFSVFMVSIFTSAFPYMITGSILLPSACHTVYNFWGVFKKESEFFVPVIFLSFLIVMPAALLSATEWLKTREKTGMNVVAI